MKATMSGALRSRTIRFALALVVATVVSEHFDALRPFLKDYGDLAAVLLAIIVGVLRFLTTEPLAAKAPPQEPPHDDGTADHEDTQ